MSWMQTGMLLINPIYNSKVKVPDGIVLSDITTYAEEEITRFIYGERPLDEWDAYVDTLNKVYGLDRYLESAAADLKEVGVIK